MAFKKKKRKGIDNFDVFVSWEGDYRFASLGINDKTAYVKSEKKGCVSC